MSNHPHAPKEKLNKLWFTASTRYLENILPSLSEEEQDLVINELNARESDLSANGGAPERYGERDQLEYHHNEHIDY